jgi:threonyl-tRNA synthetase
METFGLNIAIAYPHSDPKHPEKILGDPKIWDKLEPGLFVHGAKYVFDGPGEAAFYGPKMDLMATMP